MAVIRKRRKLSLMTDLGSTFCALATILTAKRASEMNNVLIIVFF